MSILIGAVADDFTGATDLANTLVRAGLRTVQLLGVPGPEVDTSDAQAVVVALKSRTAPVDQAVAESLAATEWLRARGARQVLSKYCSTFDSTAEGNIGPIADAMLDRLGAPFALVCPAFPGAGRTIYKGHLFVGDQLLSDSPMKDHPLTPMTDSDLVRLMAKQSRYEVGLVPLEVVRQGPEATRHVIDALIGQGKRYGVIDVVEDADLMTIGAVAQGHALVTGGSGIALGLPEAWRRTGLVGDGVEPTLPPSKGRALILAGSCSAATREQLSRLPRDWPHRRIDAAQTASKAQLADSLCDWVLEQNSVIPCVISSSADPADVALAQQAHGRAEAGEMIETLMGTIAARLAGQGVGRLIVAGGETSGAVVSALGTRALRIGPQIAPGVPWCETLDGARLALALKSGNFGGPDFFADALAQLG